MSAIIFDFDGTIADTFEVILQIFHDLTGQKSKISPAEVERLRGMSLAHAAEELHIAPWKMPFLVMRGRNRMGKMISTIQAHPGMPDTIRKLYAEGHELYIMSSNSEKNIKKFLKQHHMYKEFIEIHGSVGLLHKGRALKKLIRRDNLDPNDTWYIGDEVRDIIGSQHAGLRIMSVTWGFNSAEILSMHNPTMLLTNPDQIISVLEES